MTITKLVYCRCHAKTSYLQNGKFTEEGRKFLLIFNGSECKKILFQVILEHLYWTIKHTIQIHIVKKAMFTQQVNVSH